MLRYALCLIAAFNAPVVWAQEAPAPVIAPSPAVAAVPPATATPVAARPVVHIGFEGRGRGVKPAAAPMLAPQSTPTNAAHSSHPSPTESAVTTDEAKNPPASSPPPVETPAKQSPRNDNALPSDRATTHNPTKKEEQPPANALPLTR